MLAIIQSSLLKLRKLNIKIHQNVTLLVVLYWCKTWPLTLREEHRLSVF
jgi:hypothetical protein